MKGYKLYLLEDSKYKEIKNSQTNLLLNKNLIFSPFSILDEQLGLNWWGNYNEVKHYRQTNDNYVKANLNNVLQSLSALYILENFFYHINFYNKDDDSSNSVPTPKSKLFDSINNLKDNVVEIKYANVIDEWED